VARGACRSDCRARPTPRRDRGDAEGCGAVSVAAAWGCPMMTPPERKAFAATIRPAVRGKSDKFSWRLHQRSLKNGRERVYLMAWTFLDGYRPASLGDLIGGHVHAYQIALGFLDREWFHGNTLRNVCTPGTPTHDWAYGPGHHVAEWIEITDWFWDNYLRVGR